MSLAIFLVVGLLLACAPLTSAEVLEVFAGQDKNARVNVDVIFNDADLVRPDPPPPERTYQFAWDFDLSKDLNLDTIYDNDNESGNLLTSHRFTAPGTFTCTLTVTNDLGDSAKDTCMVTVEENEPPVIQSQDSITAFINTPYNFTASASDDYSPSHLLRWEWDFGDGTKGNDPPPIEHTYNTIRAYQCRIRVYDQEQAWSEKTITMNVIEKPGLSGDVFPVPGSGILKHKNKQVREDGYIGYTMWAAKNHDIRVTVTADPARAPVAVMVFHSQSAFLDYELGIPGTWDRDISKPDMATSQKITWKSDKDERVWIVVDNGYQGNDPFDLYSGLAEVDVTVEDLDRDNFLVDISIWVWIGIVVVLAVILAIFLLMRLAETQATRKKEKEAISKAKQERDVRVSSLRQFLDDPETAVKRQQAQVARPPPGAYPGPYPPPAGARGPPPPAARGPPPPAARVPPPPRGPPPAPWAGSAAPPPAAPQPAAVTAEAPPPPPPPRVVEAPPMPESVEEAPKLVSTGTGPVYQSTAQPKRGDVLGGDKPEGD